MKSKKSIVFFGTPQFSAVFLEKLIEDGFFISAVVTASDKKFGREQKIIHSPVKKVALKHAIPVLQPLKIRKNAHFFDEFIKLHADLAIVVAYGKILPQDLLDIPEFGFINVHPSDLPQYRGPSPMQWSLLNGDTKSAITIMQLDAGMDTGDILFKKPITINNSENYLDLQEKCARTGSEFLSEQLPNILSGEISPIKQDDEKASYSHIIAREDGFISDFSSAKKIENMGRAYYPWPGLYLLVDGKRLKIELPKATVTDVHAGKKSGTLIQLDSDTCAILCDDGFVSPESFQFEGKKKISAKEFIVGYHSLIQ